MQYVALTCRLVLLLTLVVASVSKLRAPDEFEAVLQAVIRVVPTRSRWVRVVVVVGETATAILLRIPQLWGVGFLFAAALRVAFTVVIAQLLRLKGNVSCGCFGAGSGPVGRRHLVRNLVLTGVVGLGLATTTSDSARFAYRAGGTAVAAMAAITITLVTVYVDDIAALFRAAPASRPSASR